VTSQRLACLLDTIEYMFDSGLMGAVITQVMPLPAQQAGARPRPASRDPDARELAGRVPAGGIPAGNCMLADGPVTYGGAPLSADGALPASGPRGDAVLSGAGALPVLPALRELAPGGLQRGSVVAAGDWSLFCLVLAAGASAAGAWCAIVGVPGLGVAAAADAGLDPGRLLLVADPGEGWPHVVSSLLDGCDLVLLRPPSRPAAQVRRRLEAVTRRHGGVLVIAGDWAGAQCRFSVAQQQWAGIGAGHGRLCARLVQVVADGRGAAARPRARWLWLPGPDGGVAAAAADIGETTFAVGAFAAGAFPAAAIPASG